MAALPDVEVLREKIEFASGFCCRGPGGGPLFVVFCNRFSFNIKFIFTTLAQCIPLRQQGRIFGGFFIALLYCPSLLPFLGQSLFKRFLSPYVKYPSFPFLKVVAIVSASICIF